MSKGVEYFSVKAALVQRYTVEDFYNSNRLAYAEAINAGITTVQNFSHNTCSLKHVDAARAHRYPSGQHMLSEV